MVLDNLRTEKGRSEHRCSGLKLEPKLVKPRSEKTHLFYFSFQTHRGTTDTLVAILVSTREGTRTCETPRCTDLALQRNPDPLFNFQRTETQKESGEGNLLEREPETPRTGESGITPKFPVSQLDPQPTTEERERIPEYRRP